MKTRWIAIIITIITIELLFFQACMETLELDLPGKKNTVVLNSLLNTDSIAYARMTWTNRPVSQQNDWHIVEIDDADVYLHENGEPLERLVPVRVHGKAYYEGSIPLKVNQVYRVVAQLSDGGQVAGEGKTPQHPKYSITKAGWANSLIFPKEMETQVAFRLRDTPGEKNYYRIRLFMDRGNGERRPEYIDWIGPGKQGSTVFFDDMQQSIFLDDALFDGQEIEIVVRSLSSFYTRGFLEVSALSEETFKYLRGQAFASENNDNFLVEPIPVYSNIENGLGFVGGIAVNEQAFDFIDENH